MPAIADLPLAGRGISARRLDPAQLIALAESPPDGELGDSARAIFAVVELARRSVAEGLVHPFLDTATAGGTPSGARPSTRSVSSARRDRRGAAAGRGRRLRRRPRTPQSTISIRSSSTRSPATGCARTASAWRPRSGRPNAIELFLDGLTASESVLPPHSGYAALERGSRAGSTRGSAALVPDSWRLGLHLDERASPTRTASHGSCSSSGCRRSDDPTLGLPASLLWDGGATSSVPACRRPAPRPDPPAGGARRRCSPSIGIEFDAAEPTEVELDPEQVGSSCARRCRSSRSATCRSCCRRLASLAEPRPGQPDGDEPRAGALERPPLPDGAGEIRLAARRRRRRAHGRGAGRPRRGEGARSSGSAAAGTRFAARTSRRRCASSTVAVPASGSSSSCARCRGSRRTRQGSSSARSRSTRHSLASSAPVSAVSARCRHRRR